MENYSSSYPESGDSSPRSREIDVDPTASVWDDIPQPNAASGNGKVKLMCSYGGRIQPRPHDNQLAYVGGNTKILTVDCSIKFPAVLSKLSFLSGSGIDEFCFKYQLPGEDLDSLISVTNDEDLEHMMLEYDRLFRSTPKAVARLRLFLFPLANSKTNLNVSSNSSSEIKSDRQLFVEALNNVPALSSIPLPPAPQPHQQPLDYLFGLDKVNDFVPPPPEKVGIATAAVAVVRTEHAKDESQEIQRQIQDRQRLQINGDEQEKPPVKQNGADEAAVTKVYPPGDYYVPLLQETKPAVSPLPPVVSQVTAPAVSQKAYWPEPPRTARFTSVAGGDQAVYLIPAGYPQAGQGYYAAVPRVVATAPPEGYYTVAGQRSQALTATQPAAAAKVVGGYSAGMGMEVAYESNGRPVYYASSNVGPTTAYQTVTSVGLTAEAAKLIKPPPVA